MRIGTIAAVFILGAIAGAILEEVISYPYAVSTPPRPTGVPVAARWAGGPTGGNWFECAREAEATYRCSVYADVTGVLIAKGRYKVDAGGDDVRPVLFVSDHEIQLTGVKLVKVGE